MIKKTNPLLLAALPLGALLAASTLSAQSVPPAKTTSTQAKPSVAAQPAPTNGVKVEDDGITITLSPFTVVSTPADVGYRASNTLAGSRLNSSLSDLASSVTVVTKQQLLDTGATDINDIFLYEANTEGAGNYTPVVMDRGGLKDQVAGYSLNGGTALTSSTANRIRGLSSADTAWNFYPSISRLKSDVYNADTVEISRGPNSILFGLGSPSGIVNQSLSSASLKKTSAEVNIRAGSRDSYRASLNFNQVLLKGKLAISGAALYNDTEFARKPSYDITRRQSATFTAKPFSKTTIKGFIERFSNDSRTPNSLTPRDSITPWLKAGRPVWNPLTRQVTWLDRGVTSAPYTLARTALGADGVTYKGDNVLTNVNSPYYVEGLAFQDYSRPAMYVNQDGSFSWSQRQASIFPTGSTAATISADPTTLDIYERRTTNSTYTALPSNFASNYVAPGISNKALYDWEHINATATNFAESQATSYNLEFEQQITHELFFSLGWFKQDYHTIENYSIAQVAPTTVSIDTNRYNTDGSLNTHFLSPYVEDFTADTVLAPEINENWRAMLAYDLDFTGSNGWAKWLGRHRILGLGSRQTDLQTRIRERVVMVSGDSRYVAPAASRTAGWNYGANASGIRRYYYVGGNDSIVSQAPSRVFGNPGYGGPSSGSIHTYNYSTGTWEEAAVSLDTVNYAAGGGLFRSKKSVDSLSFAAQSFFLKERIVTTIGLRHDAWKARSNDISDLTDAVLYPASNNNYLANSEELLNRYGAWEKLSANTGSFGAVVKPFKWLSLQANRSNNFNPPTTASTDIFGKKLPKPEGEGRDYGFSFNLLNNRLVARVNFFKNTNENERTGAVDTLLGRIKRADTTNFRAWAESVVRVRAGQNPGDTNWRSASVNPLTEGQKAQIADLTGLPYDWTASTAASTQTDEAKGIEYELVYNPMRNWNLKFSVAQQKSTYKNIFPEYEAWYAQRLNLWQAAHASDLAESYTLANGAVMKLRDYWTSATNFGGEARTSTPASSTPELWYASTVASEVSTARLLQGARTSGQREWRSNLLSNYEFQRGFAKGLGVGGAIRWEDKAIIGYYGQLNASSQYFKNDLSRPIYDTDAGVDSFGDLTHLDMWLSYKFPLWKNKIATKVQFNVRDLTENGGLRPVYANWDGSIGAYRIVDSRQYTVQATFSF